MILGVAAKTRISSPRFRPEAACLDRAGESANVALQSRSQTIKRAALAPAAAVEDVRVDHGDTDVLVTKELLDGADVVAGLLEREPTALTRHHIGRVLDRYPTAWGQRAPQPSGGP